MKDLAGGAVDIASAPSRVNDSLSWDEDSFSLGGSIEDSFLAGSSSSLEKM